MLHDDRTLNHTMHVALPIWRDPAAWGRAADAFAVLTALALPWSTSLVAIFVVAWLVSVTPTLDIKLLMQSLKRPVCLLPIVIFALAVVGTLWSDAPWGARLYAISPTAKLLVLPALIYHFERSARGMWVFVAFLISCTVLMVMSWIVIYEPQFALKADAVYGVPVKNYIAQSQEFALCAVALGYPIAKLFSQKRFGAAALLSIVALGFVANMAFVTVSRTALVTMPIMLLVFAVLHLKWRKVVYLLCTMIVLAAVIWATSPHLRARTTSFLTDYQLYKESNVPTSMGLRLEFWQKSLRFFAEAPVIGHGTGATRELFERAATGQVGAAAEVVGNPHNQTLYVAIQWGLLGIISLYAMWWSHLMMFQGVGLATWIGLLVVVQNFFTSLFNSHLFDFHEGWMYVLGVGIAGGMTRKCGCLIADKERHERGV